MDEWASLHPEVEVFGQIGAGNYNPKNFECRADLSPREYDAAFERANVVVAHAGMGTLITCLLAGKPVIVVPREVRYQEHRNDHQLATAKKFAAAKDCRVATNSSHLFELLNAAQTVQPGGDTIVRSTGFEQAPSALMHSLADFIVHA